jgi:hypothetical protein
MNTSTEDYGYTDRLVWLVKVQVNLFKFLSWLHGLEHRYNERIRIL